MEHPTGGYVYPQSMWKPIDHNFMLVRQNSPLRISGCINIKHITDILDTGFLPTDSMTRSEIIEMAALAMWAQYHIGVDAEQCRQDGTQAEHPWLFNPRYNITLQG